MVSTKYIKRTLKLGMPVVAGQLGFILMGATDTVMVGKVSNNSQAAVGLGSSIYFLVMILGMGILFGITSLVSIKDGENKLSESWKYINVGLLTLLPITAILCLAYWLIGVNLNALDQPLDISILTFDYMNVINWSSPFLLMGMLYSAYLNGLGKTIPNMIIAAIALIANYFFNDWMIFGIGNFEGYGFIGSGYATVLSRALLCILTIAYCYQNKLIKGIRSAYIKTEKVMDTVIEIIRFGLPIGVQLFLEVFAFAASFILAGWLGNMALTSHQIALNLTSITFMFITGISTAANIMIGNGYGAKDKKHILESAKAALFLVVLFELIFCFAFIFFGKPLLEIYTEDIALIAFSLPLMLIAAAFQISDGLQNLLMNMLRGIKDVNRPALIALVSYGVVLIPISYYLAMPNGLNMGLAGVWWGFVIGLSLASLILAVRFIQFLKTIESKW